MLQRFYDNKMSFNTLHPQQPQTLSYGMVDHHRPVLLRCPRYAGNDRTGGTNSNATPATTPG
ncbi:hypothetical protein [Micromonospora sp. S-DT3-3-22]|uniref:hypothetical protein n=1 Tax=Micromonospora sp. S-DT3-3-22 TaxID=2755359 RepID=UPI00189079F4|nr:hypothetical protein [Micromonospora sp. S-DT3-3-22]